MTNTSKFYIKHMVQDNIVAVPLLSLAVQYEVSPTGFWQPDKCPQIRSRTNRSSKKRASILKDSVTRISFSVLNHASLAEGSEYSSKPRAQTVEAI
jgi:hypothetical protein